jgi:hypothetical protein
MYSEYSEMVTTVKQEEGQEGERKKSTSPGSEAKTTLEFESLCVCVCVCVCVCMCVYVCVGLPLVIRVEKSPSKLIFFLSDTFLHSKSVC